MTDPQPPDDRDQGARSQRVIDGTRRAAMPGAISTLCRVNGPLSVATIVLALALAAWFLLRAALNRPPGRPELIATAALGALVAVLVLVAVTGLFGDSLPADTPTFIGYLITTIAFAPTALYLARMEPTRWGNLILGVACLVLPVLVLRLQQIASVTVA